MPAIEIHYLERPVAAETTTVEHPAESGLPFGLNSRLTPTWSRDPPNLPSAPVSPPKRTNFKTPASDFDSQIAIAVIGAQYKMMHVPASPNPDTLPNPYTPPNFDIHTTLILQTQAILHRFLYAPHATTFPSSVEWSSHTDTNNFYNVSALAHWPSKASYNLWAATSGFQAWWDSLDPEVCSHGWFLEVFFPNAGRMSGEITSEEREDPEVMRTRLPISARGDKLRGKKAGRGAVVSGGTVLCDRVRVQGRRNLVVVRAGQDYSMHRDSRKGGERAYAEGLMKEVAKFQNDIVPGCFSFRHMESVDCDISESVPEVTSLLMYFDDLKELETCLEHEKATLAVFGGLREWMEKGPGMRMNVQEFYELMVLKREQQMFEYICCSVGTGMLVAHREERAYLVM